MERILPSTDGQIQLPERVGRRDEMVGDTVSERIGSVIQAVADYAILEAEGLEKEAREARLMMIHSKVG